MEPGCQSEVWGDCLKPRHPGETASLEPPIMPTTPLSARLGAVPRKPHTRHSFLGCSRVAASALRTTELTLGNYIRGLGQGGGWAAWLLWAPSLEFSQFL